MVSKAKLYAQLDGMETELQERIIPHLENAVKGQNEMVFCTTDFAHAKRSKFKVDPETDALVQLGAQILILKDKLGEPSAGTIAERVCWYCRQWGDAGEGHKHNAQALARNFLEEIKSQI